jgi:hypothetical protein
VTPKGTRITRRAESSRSPLSEIFMGELRSRLQRTDELSTDSVQPFFTLQLDIEVFLFTNIRYFNPKY